MIRVDALDFLKSKITTPNLINHSLAVEAVMKKLAEHFNEDVEAWALAGLLHDIDYEETKDKPAEHSKLGSQTVREEGVAEDICQAILKHNEIHGLGVETKMEKALFVADPITGLIVAATLVVPSRKLVDLTTENVLNRFKEKHFARGANRDIIGQCENLLGLTLNDFVALSLEAMQGISDEIGL